MKQKGLRYIEKGEQYCFGQKVPVFFTQLFLLDFGGIPLPPLCEQYFWRKTFGGFGVPSPSPPPFTHKIRQTVPDRLPLGVREEQGKTWLSLCDSNYKTKISQTQRQIHNNINLNMWMSYNFLGPNDPRRINRKTKWQKDKKAKRQTYKKTKQQKCSTLYILTETVSVFNHQSCACIEWGKFWMNYNSHAKTMVDLIFFWIGVGCVILSTARHLNWKCWNIYCWSDIELMASCQ